MRVFIVMNSLAPGGAERSVVELLPALLADGISARIVCLRDTAVSLRNEVEAIGTPLTFLPSGPLVKQAWVLRNLIRTERPELIHTSIFEADLVGRLAAIGGPPVLTSLVTVAYDPLRRLDPSIRRWKFEAARTIESISARWLTDHFHAIGEEVKRSSVNRLGIRPQRITVVPRGRSRKRLGRRTTERRLAVRERMKLPDHQPVVLSVGRQVYAKGHRHLIRAFEGVVEHHPDAVLWIAGPEGAASDDLRAVAAESPVSERVRFLGHRTDVADLLSAADVFAFPSLYEGLGGAVLEAMALECPIVASDLAPLREYLTDERTALLVPPGDGPALVAKMVRMLGDAELRRGLARRAAEVFARRFEVGEANRRMIDLYAAVVQGDVDRDQEKQHVAQ